MTIRRESADRIIELQRQLHRAEADCLKLKEYIEGLLALVRMLRARL